MDQSKKNITIRELISLVSTALELDSQEMSQTSSASNIEEWDSLGIINIVTSLEKEIGVKFDILDFPLLISIESIKELLISKGYLIITE